MSEYHTVQTDFKDKEILVKALENMGLQPEVHENPVTVTSYGTSRKVHILVKKQRFGGYADMGFEKQGDKYIMHQDHMDNHRMNENKIKASYAEAKIMKKVNDRAKLSLLHRSENDEHVKIRIKVT